MLIFKIKEGKCGMERALKELKSKVIKTRQVRELQNRKEFEKPSVKKRNQLRKAAYIQKKYKQKD
jgi:small subunit ribosomal protein S21